MYVKEYGVTVSSLPLFQIKKIITNEKLQPVHALMEIPRLLMGVSYKRNGILYRFMALVKGKHVNGCKSLIDLQIPS